MPGVDGRALEEECEDAIIIAAQMLGFMAHAERRARTAEGAHLTAIKGNPGWPDLIIVGYGHVFVYELKRKGGRFQEGQREWLDRFFEVPITHVHAGVLWVPEQQHWLMGKLQRVADGLLG